MDAQSYVEIGKRQKDERTTLMTITYKWENGTV